MAQGVIELGRNPGSFETLAPTTSTGISSALLKPVRIFGVATASGATSLTLASAASAVTDYYVGWHLQTYGAAAGAGQDRVITAYNGTSKAATVATWGTTPTATTRYILIPPFEGLCATEALITVETYQVRFRIDGIAPTSTVGHIIAAGGSYLCRGTTAIKNLRFIDTASGASSVAVTVFF